jgi:hypothetical protein
MEENARILRADSPEIAYTATCVAPASRIALTGPFYSCAGAATLHLPTLNDKWLISVLDSDQTKILLVNSTKPLTSGSVTPVTRRSRVHTLVAGDH